MIRPEITAALRKNAEFLVGLALMLVGVLMVQQPGFAAQGVGAVLGAIGISVVFTAYRRRRFGSDAMGPGVVEVDERQISYFAVQGGGAISVDALARVTLLPSFGRQTKGEVHWLFEEDGGAQLLIPNSAQGSDRFFDVVAALKDVDFAALDRAMTGQADNNTVIWKKQRSRLH